MAGRSLHVLLEKAPDGAPMPVSTEDRSIVAYHDCAGGSQALVHAIKGGHLYFHVSKDAPSLYGGPVVHAVMDLPQGNDSMILAFEFTKNGIGKPWRGRRDGPHGGAVRDGGFLNWLRSCLGRR
jgi:hypothetical protein